MSDVSPMGNPVPGVTAPMNHLEPPSEWQSASDTVLPSVEDDFATLLNLPGGNFDVNNVDPMLSLEDFACKQLIYPKSKSKCKEESNSITANMSYDMGTQNTVFDQDNISLGDFDFSMPGVDGMDENTDRQAPVDSLTANLQQNEFYFDNFETQVPVAPISETSSVMPYHQDEVAQSQKPPVAEMSELQRTYHHTELHIPVAPTAQGPALKDHFEPGQTQPVHHIRASTAQTATSALTIAENQTGQPPVAPDGCTEAARSGWDSLGWWYQGKHDRCPLPTPHKHDTSGLVSFTSMREVLNMVNEIISVARQNI